MALGVANLTYLRNSLHENPGLWGRSGVVEGWSGGRLATFGDRWGVVRGSFGVVRGSSGDRPVVGLPSDGRPSVRMSLSGSFRRMFYAS